MNRLLRVSLCLLGVVTTVRGQTGFEAKQLRVFERIILDLGEVGRGDDAARLPGTRSPSRRSSG